MEAGLAALAPRRPTATCLGFHAIDDRPSTLAMPPGRFAELMRWLADSGVRGMSVAEWRAGAPPDPHVVLTFDDGFASVRRHALPVLSQLGFHATVFPIAAGLGRRTAWRAAGRPLPEARLMDAAELAELVAAGWEVGAHTVDHVYLPTLPVRLARRQIRDCRQLLEDALGVPVPAFAYPYGGSSPHLAEIVRDTFDTGWTTRPGRLDTGAPAVLLPRIMLPPRATPETVRAAGGRALPALLRARGAYDEFPPETDCWTFAEMEGVDR